MARTTTSTRRKLHATLGSVSARCGQTARTVLAEGLADFDIGDRQTGRTALVLRALSLKDIGAVGAVISAALDATHNVDDLVMVVPGTGRRRRTEIYLAMAIYVAGLCCFAHALSS